ncbi:MAG: hypothetical protein LCH96_04025 [Actinobacteria bacterium]|nr:hypothetical protein [Actinomycetota bacterium]
MKVAAEPAQGISVAVTIADPEPLDGGILRYRIRVRAAAEAAWEGRLIVTASTDAPQPWRLIPGLFYGENRPEECFRVYPRFAPGPPDPGTLTSDHWSFRADRAATPAVFAWGTDAAVALAAQEVTDAGLTGLGFADRGGMAEVHLSFPYREEPWSYFGDAEPRPARAQTAQLDAGEVLDITFDYFVLGPDRHGYAPVLRALHAEAVAANPLVPWMDAPTAAELTAHGLHRWHYRPDPPVLLETVAFDRAIDGDNLDRQAMHIAWVSGIPWAYALARHARRVGNPEYLRDAVKVIDFCCSELSPSGTFWGTWYRAHGWRGSWTHLPNGLHARTLGEATLFLLRAIAEETAAGRDHPSWRDAAVSNLRHMLGRQRPDGNLGAVHDMYTGEVLQWSGAAGLAWIPAFVEAAEFGRSLGGPDPADLVAAARKAGDYYARFVHAEYINGAPEDVDLAPTSEDGYSAVMAYAALVRHDGDPRWLGLARRSAEWMLTFRYSYNVHFEDTTILGAYGFATRGGDQASVSNQHLGSYGLICAAEMMELAERLDDPWLRERTEENAACFRQFIARDDGDFNAYRGMVTERYYQTDCFAPKGSMLTLSHAWCLGVQLLGQEQALECWGRLARPQPARQAGHGG